MHFKNFAFIGLAASLLLASPAAAAQGACCAEAVAPATTPARQAVDVWFQRPVWVGNHILQGRYVIEHDNDRMARGEPCTRIYAYDDRRMPVVAFNCVHLDRDHAKENRVTLASKGDGMQQFLEFQFAGETAAHGLPSER